MEALNWEVLVTGMAVVVLNVLDSVTTAIAFKQYPDKQLKAEGNPIMRWLMLKSGLLAEVVKQCSILAIVVANLLLFGNSASLRPLAIIFSLVVLNNTFVVTTRAVTKTKVMSPIERLRRLLRIQERLTYPLALILLLGLALLINYYVF